MTLNSRIRWTWPCLSAGRHEATGRGVDRQWIPCQCCDNWNRVRVAGQPVEDSSAAWPENQHHIAELCNSQQRWAGKVEAPAIYRMSGRLLPSTECQVLPIVWKCFAVCDSGITLMGSTMSEMDPRVTNSKHISGSDWSRIYIAKFG